MILNDHLVNLSDELWYSEIHDIWSTHGFRQSSDRKINLRLFIDRCLSLIKNFRCHVFIVTVFSNCRIKNRRFVNRQMKLSKSFRFVFAFSRRRCVCSSKEIKSFFEAQSWFTSSLSYCFLIEFVSSKFVIDYFTRFQFLHNSELNRIIFETISKELRSSKTVKVSFFFKHYFRRRSYF